MGCRHMKQAASPTERSTQRISRTRLPRYAGVWSLWALGVGAVISGHFSGWNFGFGTGGWGGLLVAGIIIGIMYTRPRLLHRRNEPGVAAYRRGLFVRPLLDGSVGRLHHRPLRERRIRGDAGGHRDVHRAPT